MLSYEELVAEIRKLSPVEKLALLEEVAHSLRTEAKLTGESKIEQDNTSKWPSDFFSQTYGMFRNDPLERLPQGEYEVREELG